MVLAMNLLRELIRLIFMSLGLSNRRLAEIVGCSHQMVGRVKVKIGALTYTYDEYAVMDDDEITVIFYPKMNLRLSKKRRPDADEIIRERSKRPKKYGKSRKLLFLEYRDIDPATALGQTQYYKLANQIYSESKLEYRKECFPGEYLCVDYAGINIYFYDNGAKKKLYVFVACLPYSNKMFAFATLRMTAYDWILGLTKAVNYYGKTAEIILFDNAKAVVRKPGLIAELSDMAIDFAKYHKVVCDTSRVATPRDNCHAEKSVQFIEGRILLIMREMQFFSDGEANDYLCLEVEKLNNEIMQEYKVSRNTRFEKELSHLKALPAKAYEPIIKHGSVKSPANYLIKYDQTRYEIPHEYRNKIIEYKVTGTHIRFYCKSKQITEHELSNQRHNIVRLEGQMPANHLAQSKKTKDEFITWARSFNEDVVAIIKEQYKEHANVKSQYAGKRCIAIKEIAEKYSRESFIQICRCAKARKMFTPSYIELIAQTKLYEEYENIPAPHVIQSLENNRGLNNPGGHRNA